MTTTVETHTTVCGVTFAVDTVGFYPLTPCCHASGKGSMAGDETVTVCRSCHQQVSPVYGTVADPQQPHGKVAAITSALAGDRCPDPYTCGDHTVWTLTERFYPKEGETA